MPDPTGESLAAALDDCGFRFYGDMVGIAWGPTGKEHRETVTDARRWRELVEGLKVV